MKTFRFVTYCTPDYLVYAINAIESAIRNHPASKGHIVCVGELPEYFQGLKSNVEVRELRHLPKADKSFLGLLNNRNNFEALISIKPRVLINFLEESEDSDVIVYLDTDIFFFDSLDDFEQQHLNVDFIAFQHMYPKEPTIFPYGKYNAGLIIIRKSPESFAILREWERLCLEWCQLSKDGARYADQGYLEELLNMPRSKGVKSSTINIGMHYLWKGPRVSLVKDRPCIAGEPLVAFHFHGMKIRGKYLWTGINRYGFELSNFRKYEIIYKPAINGLFRYLTQQFKFESDAHPTSSIASFVVEVLRRTKRTVVKIPLRSSI
jgi:hypothetical protein